MLRVESHTLAWVIVIHTGGKASSVRWGLPPVESHPVLASAQECCLFPALHYGFFTCRIKVLDKMTCMLPYYSRMKRARAQAGAGLGREDLSVW